MKISSLDVAGVLLANTVQLQSPPTGPVLNLTAQSFSCNNNSTDASCTSVALAVSWDSLNLLKTLRIALQQNTTILALTPAFMTDVTGNPTTSISNVIPSTFTPDTTAIKLQYFDLDMELLRLTIGFDEPYDPLTVNGSQITLFSGNGANTSLTDLSRLYFPSSLAFVISLSIIDSNEMKRLGIGASQSSSFLTIAKCTDLSGNDINNTLPPLAARLFIAQVTRPTIVSFAIDLRSYQLNLSFSETIKSISINSSLFSLLGSDGSIVPLSGAVILDGDSAFIRVNFSSSASKIKANSFLGKSPFDTSLITNSGSYTDMVLLPAVPQTLSASNYVPDDIKPRLVSFNITFDLFKDGLVLVFDEPVNSGSLAVTSIVLLNSLSSSSSSYQLQDSLVDSSINSSTIAVTLSFRDRNAIKLLSSLATNLNNTVLTLATGGVQDMAIISNSNDQTTLPTSSYVSDRTSPSLTQYMANMNDGTVTLNFNEPVNASSLNVSGLILQSQPNATLQQMYRLTGGATNSSNGLQIVLTMSIFDLNNIKKRIDTIFSSLQRAFLQVEQSFILDMTNNAINSIPSSAAKQAVLFFNSSVRPSVVSFNINMTSEVLVIVFSETVRLSTLRPEFIVFTIDYLGQSSASFRLTGGLLIASSPDVSVSIQMIHSDVNFLKSKSIGLSQNSIWMTSNESLVSDMNGNPILPLISGANALPVSQYFPCTNQPQLVQFDVNFNTNLWVLTFNEAVDWTTVNSSRVSLVAALSGSEYFFQRGISLQSSDDGTVITFTLSRADLDEVKRIPLMCKNSSSCYVRISSGFVYDAFGNPNVDSGRVLVSQYVPDTTPPFVESFSIDLSSRIVVMNFSETVSAAYNIANIALSNSLNSSADRVVYRFTPGAYAIYSSILGSDSSILSFHIGDQDFNQIVVYDTLCSNGSPCFLILFANAVKDMSGNANVPRDNPSLPFSSLVTDAVRPTLANFTFNYDSKSLVLVFTESVRAATIRNNSIVLQSSSSSNAVSHTLGSSVFLVLNGPTIWFNLSEADLNAIKLHRPLYRNVSSSYLSMTEPIIDDMSGNPVNLISSDSAVIVGQFSRDTVPPTLVAFSLNLSSECLSVTFSEAVDSRTFMLSKLVLQDQVTSSLTFKFGMQINALTDGVIINACMSRDNMNSIKILGAIASNTSNTFLSVQQGCVADMSGNLIQTSLPLRASSVIADIVPPFLNYYNLSMDSGLIVFSLNESCDWRTVNISTLSLFDTSGAMQILSGSLAFNLSGTSISVQLDTNCLNSLKFKQICLVSSSCFLSFSQAFISDMYSNPTIPITLLSPQFFFADVTAPTIVSYNIDMSLGFVSLSFSEPVNTSTFKVQLLRAQISSSLATLERGYYFIVSTAVSSTNMNLNMNFSIALLDLYNIKLFKPSLWKDFSNAWLAANSSAIYDNSGNGLAKFSPQQPATLFIADTVPPTLISWSIDVNTGLIYLVFDEPIQMNRLTPNSVTLFAVTNVSFTLSTSVVSTVADSSNATISIGSLDLLSLKALGILKSSSSTKLQALAGFALDASNNPSLFIAGMSTLSFTADNVIPNLASWSLDLQLGNLQLTFSEPVDNVTLDATQIILYAWQNSSSPFVQKALSQSTGFYVDSFKTTIILYLSAGDRLDIALSVLSKKSFQNAIFISFSSVLVGDIQGNPVQQIQLGSNYTARSMTPDLRSPNLRSWALDMSALTLQFSFDVPVLASSFTPVSVLLQSRASRTSSQGMYYLSGGTVSPAYGYELTVQLTLTDANNIKRVRSLGKSVNSSYISFSADMLQGLNQQYILSITSYQALEVSLYVGDLVPPQLIAFSVNMTVTPQISLSFSETVQFSSINPNTFALKSSVSDSFTFYLQSSIVSTNYDNDVIVISLSQDDSNALKNSTLLFTSLSNTAITLGPSSFIDMANNQNNATFMLGAASFGPDIYLPLAISFGINMNSATILLSVSETVNTSSFIANRFVIQSTLPPVASFPLTALKSVVKITLTQISITMNQDDTNRIKEFLQIHSTSGTVMQVLQGAFLDMAGNRAQQVSMTAAQYSPDVTSPKLIGVFCNLSSQEIFFTFDEPMSGNISAVVASKIQLSSPGGDSMWLSRLTSKKATGITLAFQMDQSDLNSLKLQRSHSGTLDRLVVSVISGAFEDLATTPNKVSDTILNATIYEDYIPPKLLSFVLDMNLGLISLNFDEPILVSSIQSSDALISNNVGDTFALQNSTSLYGDSVSVVLNISKSLQNVIETNVNVATQQSNTFLCFLSSFVQDLVGNQVVAVNCSNGLQVGQFISNTNLPRLLSYDYDLNQGQILLYFDETVNSSSINSSSLSISSNQLGTPASSTYRLQNSLFRLSPRYSSYIRLVIHPNDLNALKALQITNTQARTWLSLDAVFVRSMGGFVMVPLLAGISSRMPMNWVPDVTPPSTLSFSFSMNTSSLTISFSETMASSSFDITKITLSNAPSNTSSSWLLLNPPSAVFIKDDPILSINLGILNLNDIKRPGNFCVSVGTCFLSLSANAVQDMAGNPEITLNFMQASVVVNDTISPILLTSGLDMDNATLSLTFIEPVLFQSVQIPLIKLSNPNGFVSYTLTTNSQLLTTVNGEVMSILIGQIDLNWIKQLFPIFNGSVLLSLPKESMKDMNRNVLAAVVGSPINAMSVDRTPPTLQQFDIDMNFPATIYLYFSETIKRSSFNVSRLIITNGTVGVSLFSSVIVNNATITQSANLTSLFFQISAQERDSLQLNSICAGPSSCFISWNDPFITDMQGNAIAAPAQPIMATNLQQDVQSPLLLSAKLDMNSSSLLLTFSEVVRASSLETASITLQNVPVFSAPPIITYAVTIGDPPTQTQIFFELTDNTLGQFPAYVQLKTWKGNSSTSLANLNFTTSGSSFDVINGSFTHNLSPGVGGSLVASTQFRSLSTPSYTITVNNLNDPDNIFASLQYKTTQNPYLGLSIAATSLDKRKANVRESWSLSYSSSWSLDGRQITVLFGQLDEDQLKTFSMLGKLSTFSYISLASSAVMDMASNSVVSISSDNAQAIASLTLDTIPPSLLSFSLDMLQGVAVLSFSEVLDPIVNISSLVFQSAQNKSSVGTQYYQLQSTVTYSIVHRNVSILISWADLNAIKCLHPLGFQNTESFLMTSSALARDTSGNKVVSISCQNALPVSYFTPDSLSPQLQNFTVNMTNNSLTLFFSESVNQSSLIPSLITLLGAPNSASAAVTVGSNSTVVSTCGFLLSLCLTLTPLLLFKQHTTVSIIVSTLPICLSAVVQYSIWTATHFYQYQLPQLSKPTRFIWTLLLRVYKVFLSI